MKQTDPLRTCIATGETLPKEQLLRFVISPENKVVLDVKGHLPGKGIWLQPRASLLQDACKRNLFSKAARQKVLAEADLAEKVEKLLLNRALAYLNRARMAREMASGHEKVLSSLQCGEAAILIHAEDASEDGCKKLDKYAEEITIIKFGTREQLSATLHLPNPVHITLKKGGLAQSFFTAFERWREFKEKV